MIDQKSSVIVLEPDLDKARRIASQIEFLGHSALLACDESALRKVACSSPTIVAMYVAADAKYALLRSALQVIADASLRCACFCLKSSRSKEELPATLRSRIQNVVSENPDYQELLETLREGASFFRRVDVKNGSSTYLRRNLVGSSPAMGVVHKLIEQVATTEASVLVTGESGTGKEVVARCIHELSPRREFPFVPINCGAIPAELLESELFGHEKGAFTGAVSARQGRFEIAEGGTLFLDEIGDMPLDMQVKLLRVLQELTFERVGSHKTIRSNVRIVAATHRDLDQLVAEGKFRMDLFYRLNVFPIEITPLRKRATDIPHLVEGYIKRLERESGGALRLSECAMACLASYYWPGNVRELFNLLERLSILYPQKLVKWSDLPDKFRPNQELFVESEDELPDRLNGVAAQDLPRDGIDLRPHLASIERSLMTQALTQSEWVVARAAKLLNLQRTTLVEKMRKFEINRPEEMTEY